MISARVAACESWTDSTSVLGLVPAGSGVAEFGFTAMMGVPRVIRDRTLYEPAKTDWVVTGPPSPASTSTASVISPDEVLIDRRPAISLPSVLDGISTAAGEVCSTSCASTSALGATR